MAADRAVSDDMEREANLFAMELLMPYDSVMQDLREMGKIDVENDPRIKGLARRYKVTEQLMTIRLAQLMKDTL
ncbi:MAG: ImmA/IrrE family metallo-endopeptidase [Planctomycetota bacterium]